MSLIALQNKIVIFLGILFIPFFAFAQTVISDNFDSYSTGFIQSVGSANWFHYNNLDTLRVATTSPFSTPNYLGYGPRGAFNKRDLNSYSDIWVGYKFKAITYPTFGYLPIPILNYNLDGSPVVGRYALFGIWQQSGNFYVYGRTACDQAFGQQEQITGITTSDNLQIWFYLDLDNKMYQVHVNNWSSYFYPFIQTNDCVTTNDHARIIGIEAFSYTGYRVDDFQVISTSPFEIDGVCGSDNNNKLLSDPINLCSAGEPSELFVTATGWSWSCYGENGGLAEFCNATYGGTAENGSCGADNGQNLTSEPVNLCTTGFIVPATFVITATGWSWDCQGLNGGEVSHCTASKSVSLIDYPESPEQEDCSSYQIPNSWFCQINNTFKDIFFPSKEKIEELNQTYNSISNKAPFNYLNTLQHQVETLDIQNGSMTMTLMGSTGVVDLDAWGDVSEKIKTVSSLIFILSFLFWGLNYIKHIFK